MISVYFEGVVMAVDLELARLLAARRARRLARGRQVRGVGLGG